MNIFLPIRLTLRNLSRQAVCPKCAKFMQRCNYRVTSVSFGKWEPDGLNEGPEIAEYEILHVQMKSYDYPVLESYTKYVHKLSNSFGLESDSYAVPGKSSKVELFYPRSTRIEHEYNLTKYERVVQLEDVPSTTLPIFIEAIRLNAPAGIEVSVKLPDPVEEEDRYIPDQELIALKDQIEELEEKKSDLKKGKF